MKRPIPTLMPMARFGDMDLTILSLIPDHVVNRNMRPSMKTDVNATIIAISAALGPVIPVLSRVVVKAGITEKAMNEFSPHAWRHGEG